MQFKNDLHISAIHTSSHTQYKVYGHAVYQLQVHDGLLNYGNILNAIVIVLVKMEKYVFDLWFSFSKK